MHLPDGFIPLWQCAIYYIIIIVIGYFAIRWARENLDERKIPLLAVLAAGIFAIQALNIPIPFGTSGHMVGGALVAILLGSPFAGFLVIAIILIIQGLLTGDGGLTALGANIFNMGVIGSWVGFYGFKALKPTINEIPASFVAAFLSVFVMAITCAIELWLAGTFPLTAGLMYMGLYHILIGLIGEGLITAIVYSSILKLRPDMVAKIS